MKTSMLLIGIVIGFATDAQGTVAFLVPQGPQEKLSPENDTVRELAERLWRPCRCGRSRAGGSSITGADRAAGAVLGYMVPPGRRGGVLGAAGRRGGRGRAGPFDQGGRSLLLSGVAAGLMAPLGLEKLRARPVVFGHDRGQAGLASIAQLAIRPSAGTTWTATCCR